MSSRSGGVSSHGNNTSTSAINTATCVTSPTTTSTADRRKSGDFSISAILSEDTGSSSRKAKVTPVRVREQSASSGMLISPPGRPMIPMSTPSRYNPHLSTSHFTPTTATPTSHWAQTGALNQSVSLSPFNVSLLLLASSPTSSDVGSSQGIDTRDKFTNDSSLGMLSTVAMYHSGLLEGGGEGEQREKEGGSDQREGVSSVPAAVGDRMAQMRLESSSDTADTTLSVDDRRSTPPPPCSPSFSSAQTRSRGKGTTPFILKRDRKRRRQLTESFLPHTSSTEVTKSTNSEQALKSSHTEHAAALDTGFLSPTPAQKSPRHTNLSFSPSIFLSRPNSSTDRSLHTDTSLRHDSPSTTSTATHGGRKDVSVADGTTESALSVSDEGCDKNHDQCSSVSMETHSSTVQLSSFATSTPIKKDKENTRTSGHISPTYPSPSESSETKRPRLRGTTHDTSSGSDSEVPVKKCRSRSHALQHRSKARAQLSPLLENACSPIAKAEQRPPSSLLTANYPTSSASTPNPPPGVKEPLPKISVQDPQTPTTPHPPIAMPCLPHHHVPPVPFPFPCNPLPPHYPPQPNLCLGMMPVAPNPLFPMSVSPLSPPHTSYFIPPCPPAISPTTANLLHPSSLYYYNAVSRAYSYPAPTAAAAAAVAATGNVSQKWGGSPLSTQWEKTGQIQSVPPWFIFEQNRPEGKRLRLTEAINRSLSETPSHNPKLPAEWTKYACGQTDDQRLLTQKARQFLQSGRRQLTFDNINT